MRFHFNYKSRFIAGLLIALSSMLACTADASARNLFVSPSGDNSDGSTWKKAWQSFTNIDWKQVVAGDQIIVDGGAAGITYTGAFTIPIDYIVIRQAGGEGRNGQVTISGSYQNPVQTGVTVAGSNVSIIANQQHGIKIAGFQGECIRIQTNNNTLRNLELGPVYGFPPYGQGRVGALVFGGYNNQFVNCYFKDTSRCAVEKPVAGIANLGIFRHCIFEGGYGWWGEWGVGIYGARPDGTTVTSTIQANRCIFGPVFNTGVDVVQGRVGVSDSLFLGANHANVSFNPDAGSTAKMVINNCTLYEPNYSGQSQHQMLDRNLSTNGNGTLKVANSIVYGGAINIPVTQVVNAGGNFQYHVTGNTTALAPALVDPMYVSESTLWTPVNPQTYRPRNWTIQTYFLSEGSPAVGKGSNITDVQAITPAFGPNSGLPPMGGP